MDQAKEMAKIAFEALEDKKGENVCAIDISSVSVLADDFIITYFTRGAKFQNLSIEIYSMTHRRISPKINALSALLFLAVLIVMILINIRDKHEEKVKK